VHAPGAGTSILDRFLQQKRVEASLDVTMERADMALRCESLISGFYG